MAYALVLFTGIAVWRIAVMLYSERGPLDIFTRVRAYLARKQKRSGGMYDMIGCFRCLSIWVAIPFALLLADNPANFVLYTLVLSAEAMFLARVFDKLK